MYIENLHWLALSTENRKLLEYISNGVDFHEEHWLWHRSVNKDGYAHVNFEGVHGSIHRVFYKIFVEDISDDLELDHLCSFKNCFNPDCLDPVSPRTNTRRANGWYQSNDIWFCKRNHAIVDPNIIYEGSITKCRKCKSLLKDVHA